MIRRRREKVFGPGRAVPLDRNAKARILAYARAWGARHRQPGQHKGPITRAFLEVLEALLWGFHNSPLRLLLPELRGDRRQGRVRPQHRGRGAEGAGVGRRADLAEPDHPDPRDLHATCSAAMGEPLAGHPHLQRLRVPRSESSGPGGSCFQVRKSDGNTEPRDSNLCHWHQRSTRTARWSAPWHRFGAAIEGRLLTNGSGGTV